MSLGSFHPPRFTFLSSRSLRSLGSSFPRYSRSFLVSLTLFPRSSSLRSASGRIVPPLVASPLGFFTRFRRPSSRDGTGPAVVHSLTLHSPTAPRGEREALASLTPACGAYRRRDYDRTLRSLVTHVPFIFLASCHRSSSYSLVPCLSDNLPCLTVGPVPTLRLLYSGPIVTGMRVIKEGLTQPRKHDEGCDRRVTWVLSSVPSVLIFLGSLPPFLCHFGWTLLPVERALREERPQGEGTPERVQP